MPNRGPIGTPPPGAPPAPPPPAGDWFDENAPTKEPFTNWEEEKQWFMERAMAHIQSKPFLYGKLSEEDIEKAFKLYLSAREQLPNRGDAYNETLDRMGWWTGQPSYTDPAAPAAPGPTTVAGVAGGIGANGLPNWVGGGIDKTKWDDPTHTTDKYVVQRALIATGLSPAEIRAQFASGIGKAVDAMRSLGYEVVSNNQIFKQGIGRVDVIHSNNKEIGWRLVSQDRDGKVPWPNTKTPPDTKPPTTPPGGKTIIDPPVSSHAQDALNRGMGMGTTVQSLAGTPRRAAPPTIAALSHLGAESPIAQMPGSAPMSPTDGLPQPQMPVEMAPDPRNPMRLIPQRRPPTSVRQLGMPQNAGYR